MPTFLRRGIRLAESLREKYAGGGRVEWNVVEGSIVLKGKDASKKERDHLFSVVPHNRLRVECVQGDGNCFFRTVAEAPMTYEPNAMNPNGAHSPPVNQPSAKAIFFWLSRIFDTPGAKKISHEELGTSYFKGARRHGIGGFLGS